MPYSPFKVTLWCVAASTTFFFSPVHAAEISDHFELSPEQLFDATVISASKTSEKLLDAPAAIFVLTNEDIMRSGATSIPEALRLVPGVEVAQVNTSNWAITVRGFNNTLANKLLVLIDGREVYSQLYSGVYWDAQDTMLEDIDRIEVIRGPGATLWGSNAVNGVINIITKKASDTQGTLASAIAGDQEKGLISLRHGGKIGMNGHYRTYAKYTNREEQQKPNGADARDDWNTYRSGFRADLGKATDDHNFTFQGDAYRSDAGQFTSSPSLTLPYNPVAHETLQARGGNVLGRWTKTLTNDSEFSLQSYVDYALRDQNVLRDERGSFDLDGQYTLPSLDRHKIIVGGRYRLTMDDLSGVSPEFFVPTSRTDNLFSGFIQDKITLKPDRWFLTLGSKFEHNDYTGFEIQPTARLQWHPSNRQMVWSSVSRAVRTPSRLERDLNITSGILPPRSLGFSNNPINVTLQANPNFDSEEMIAYELGYRHQLTPSLLFDVASFFNDYSKLSSLQIFPGTEIINPSGPNYYRLPYVSLNEMKGRTYGVETFVSWRASNTFNLSASHSYLKMDLTAPTVLGAPQDIAEDQSPLHHFNVRASWDVTHNHTLDTMLYYTGDLPNLRIGSYWRLDTRWGWRISDRLQFSLVGQNLLDDAHREFLPSSNINATEINRTLYGKLTWRF